MVYLNHSVGWYLCVPIAISSSSSIYVLLNNGDRCVYLVYLGLFVVVREGGDRLFAETPECLNSTTSDEIVSKN